MSKYGHRTHNWFEAIVNKLGGEEKAEAFLRGEITTSEPEPRWTTDSDGAIRFQVTGLGLTGEQWIERLESKHKLTKCAKDVLNSPNFVSCDKDKVYNLVVLSGKKLFFSDKKRNTKNIRAEADRRGLIHGKDLPTEIGCLIREIFTNKEIEQMGFNWLMVMHESIGDSIGTPGLLGTGRDRNESWLIAHWAGPGDRWAGGNGFVFGASQD